MSARAIPALASAALAMVLALGPSGARAQLAGNGFHAGGSIVVQANVSGSPLTIGGNVALYHRGNLYRLDLLSLAFPGTNSGLSAAAGALLAPGGATVIYDGASGAITAYSNANRTYYAEAPKAAPAASRPTPSAAAPPATDPLETLAGIARQLRNVQRASIQLTGHGTANGHPVSNIDVLVRRQLPGKPLEDYHATLALADDLDGFPVQLLLSSTPPSPNSFGGSLRLDLTNVAREQPADAIFAIPAGFARVNSIADVLRPPGR
ncbi:MAG: hypothetical protein ABR591_01880 [Candidatus Velthaea sp.]